VIIYNLRERSCCYRVSDRTTGERRIRTVWKIKTTLLIHLHVSARFPLIMNLFKPWFWETFKYTYLLKDCVFNYLDIYNIYYTVLKSVFCWFYKLLLFFTLRFQTEHFFKHLFWFIRLIKIRESFLIIKINYILSIMAVKNSVAIILNICNIKSCIC
jgi:hypothetical protein